MPIELWIVLAAVLGVLVGWLVAKLTQRDYRGRPIPSRAVFNRRYRLHSRDQMGNTHRSIYVGRDDATDRVVLED
jgi:uncharacterized membrane-anchored protein YhcB (DUF1043 family)